MNRLSPDELKAAAMSVANLTKMAKQVIDSVFDEGYAKANPELVGQLITAAAQLALHDYDRVRSCPACATE